MGISRFILRRLAFMVLTFLVLSVAIFYTTTFFPPLDRAAMLVPASASHPERYDLFEIASRYNFFAPFYVQYFDWLKESVLGGKLGYSTSSRGFVLDVIVHNLAPTIELVMYSAPLIIFGGIKLGVYSAKRAHRRAGREDKVDSAIRVFMTLAYSLPVFFTGLLSLSIFFLNLHWFAPGRIGQEAQFELIFTSTGSWKWYTGLLTIDSLLNGQFWVFLDTLRHLVLPVATLTVSVLPVVAKVTRSSMLTELGRSYITTAKAKGLKDVEVISHARRNAMVSILTVSSILFGNLLTGIIVTEYVFSIYGVGAVALAAARGLDFSLLVGLSVFFCMIFVAINLLVDIIYTYVDPRIKL